MYDQDPTQGGYGQPQAPPYDPFSEPTPAHAENDPTQQADPHAPPSDGSTPPPQPSLSVSREQFEEQARRYEAQQQRLADELAALRAQQVQQPQYQPPQPRFDPNQARAQLREELSRAYVNDPVDAMIEWGSKIYQAAAASAQQAAAPFAGATSDLTTESFRAQQSQNDPYFRHVEQRFNEYVQQARPTLSQSDPNTARQSLQVLYNAAKGEVLGNLAQRGQLAPPPRQAPPAYGVPGGGYSGRGGQAPPAANARQDRLGQIQQQTMQDLGYSADPEFMAALKQIEEEDN